MSKFYFQLVCFIWLAGAFRVNAAGQEKVEVYELKRGNFSLKFTNYGARLMNVLVPDKNGNVADIVLGYDTIQEYMKDTKYFGPIVGRVANRIGNAQFTLNGTTYKLRPNENNSTTIHGGPTGFSQRVWKMQRLVQDGPTPSITFTYYSADGEEGFPGAIACMVSYAMTGPYKLTLVMKAKSLNKPTPISLALHSYFNLGGHNSGEILSDQIQIFGPRYTPMDAKFIPTGKIENVRGTAYDFLEPQTIKSRFDMLSKDLKGFDMNYDMDNIEQRVVKPIAIVRSNKSGRVLKLWSNAPGMQFFTGNYLTGVIGKGGHHYQDHDALCLETLGFPDSVNHPNFPSQIVYPGNVYNHIMVFEFSTA